MTSKVPSRQSMITAHGLMVAALTFFWVLSADMVIDAAFENVTIVTRALALGGPVAILVQAARFWMFVESEKEG